MSARIPPERPTSPTYQKARAIEGPLSAQLAAYDAMLRERLPEVGVAYQGLVDHLTSVEAGKNAPGVGDELPPFLLPDETGRLRSLEELIADGPLIVSFNRGNWCPYCWLELSALQECYPAIVEQGGSVVSITPDVATFSLRLKRRLSLSFPVLTDLDNSYAMELGLAFSLTDALRNVYVEADIDLGAFQRSDAWFLPIPATLVIDRRGLVHHAYVNADFRERIDAERLPALLSAL